MRHTTRSTWSRCTDTPFQRIVYGVIDYDVPRIGVRLVDRVSGASTPVIEGRWFMYVDPLADP